MYTPRDFVESRLPVLHDAIRANAFGTLVTAGEGGIEATHVPFVLARDEGPMDPHNAQAADLSLPLADWGLSTDATLDVQDLLHDQSLSWRGTTQHVWLGLGQPYAVWHVRLPGV